MSQSKKQNLMSKAGPAIAQCVIVLGAVGTLLLAPRAGGQTILFPLTEQAARELPAFALRNDARIVAGGPLSGSILIHGNSIGFAEGLVHHATLVLSAPAGGCLGEGRK